MVHGVRPGIPFPLLLLLLLIDFSKFVKHVGECFLFFFFLSFNFLLANHKLVFGSLEIKW